MASNYKISKQTRKRRRHLLSLHEKPEFQNLFDGDSVKENNNLNNLHNSTDTIGLIPTTTDFETFQLNVHEEAVQSTTNTPTIRIEEEEDTDEDEQENKLDPPNESLISASLLAVFFSGNLTQSSLKSVIELTQLFTNIKIPKTFNQLFENITEENVSYSKTWHCQTCLKKVELLHSKQRSCSGCNNK